MKAERYSIGSDVWPGLSKLNEEAGEVVQVIGKLMGTGGEAAHWDGSDLRERLIEEMGDVLAAVFFVVHHNGLNFDAVIRRQVQKRELFEKWHREQQPPQQGDLVEVHDECCEPTFAGSGRVTSISRDGSRADVAGVGTVKTSSLRKVEPGTALETLLRRPYKPPALFIREEVELGSGYHSLNITHTTEERGWSEPWKKSSNVEYRDRIVRVPYPPVAGAVSGA